MKFSYSIGHLLEKACWRHSFEDTGINDKQAKYLSRLEETTRTKNQAWDTAKSGGCRKEEEQQELEQKNSWLGKSGVSQNQDKDYIKGETSVNVI